MSQEDQNPLDVGAAQDKLLQRAGQGDKEALMKLCEAYVRKICRRELFLLGHGPPVCESDVAQSVLKSLLRKGDEVVAALCEGERLWPYLARMTKNKAIDA